MLTAKGYSKRNDIRNSDLSIHNRIKYKEITKLNSLVSTKSVKYVLKTYSFNKLPQRDIQNHKASLVNTAKYLGKENTN